MKKLVILCAAVLMCARLSYPTTVKQFQNEIKKKSDELENIQSSIKQKEAEKTKYAHEEKDIKKELTKVNRELENIRMQGIALKKKIKRAEQNLKKAEKELKLAGWEKNQWQDAINRELDMWYRDHRAINEIFENPVLERLRFDALIQKKGYAKMASERENLSKNAMVTWQNAQKNLLGLKQDQDNMLVRQNDYKKLKEDLLKTTVGRRLEAEEEIKDLNSSAQDMINFLAKLEKEKKKTEAEAMAKQEFKKRRGQLPWPVEGKIISEFGKFKHPELDTYVINNGIKIQAGKSDPVKAVSSGEIMFSGEFRAYGQMIILDNKGGFYTIYGNLGQANVKQGQKVKQGDVIGTLADSSDPYLYFEVRSGNTAEDPKLWLK